MAGVWRWIALAALALIAFVVVRAPGERTVARAPTALPADALFVDADSRGGRCADRRAARAARRARTPWCSLGRAVAAAPAGATVVVRGGRHPRLELDGASRRSSPLTLQAAPGEPPELDGATIEESSGLQISGFRITGGVLLRDGARDIALTRNRLTGAGVTALGVERLRISGNAIRDVRPDSEQGAFAIKIAAYDDTPSRDIIVSGNRIEHVPDDPVQVSESAGVTIDRNVIRDAHPSGLGEHTDAIHVLGVRDLVIRRNDIRDVQHGIMFTDLPSSAIRIENNVITRVTAGYGMKTDGDSDMPGLRVVNNTWHDTRYGVVFRRPHAGAVVLNNIFDRVDGLGDQPVARNNLVADPIDGLGYGDAALLRPARFRAPSGGDMELLRGSPGVDAGVSAGAPPTDRLGRPRRDDPATRNRPGASAVDLGALERQAGRRVAR